MSKDEGGRNSSFSEKPVRSRPRRLVDWINPTGAKKIHSLIDKVYKRKNLEMAWEKVKENRGSGGVDGQTLEAFEAQLVQRLDRLHRELKEDAYRPGAPGLAGFETRAKHQWGKAVGWTNFSFSTLHWFTRTSPLSWYAYARKLLHGHCSGTSTRPRLTGLRCR